MLGNTRVEKTFLGGQERESNSAPPDYMSRCSTAELSHHLYSLGLSWQLAIVLTPSPAQKRLPGPLAGVLARSMLPALADRQNLATATSLLSSAPNVGKPGGRNVSIFIAAAFSVLSLLKFTPLYTQFV